MGQFWSVARGCINWKGNRAGIAHGWRGPANHDYYVLLATLASPAERRYQTETHIPDKSWCAPRAIAEFSRIVSELFPEADRAYTPNEVAECAAAYRTR